MVLRMKNGSQWSEVVWGLKSLPESGQKVVGKHPKEGWWWLPWRLRGRERKESFDVLPLGVNTWCKMTLNTWLKIALPKKISLVNISRS